MIRQSDIHPASFGLSRGAEPVRKIRPRTGRLTMPGWFPTDKGSLDSLRTETLFELAGLGHFEINPEVTMMATQPHHLYYYDPTSDGLTVRRSYTPDVALLMTDGAVIVVDFKPASWSRQSSWRRKSELLSAAYERDHGIKFTTITEESTLIEPRRRNVATMLMHRRTSADPEAQFAVSSAIDRLTLPTTIGAIAALASLSAPPHVDRTFSTVLGMAMRGVLRLDLGIPLGPDTRVRYYEERVRNARRWPS